MTKKKKIVLAIVIVLILALLGLVIWLVFFKYRTDMLETTNESYEDKYILETNYKSYEEKYIDSQPNKNTLIYNKFEQNIYISDYIEYNDEIIVCGTKYREDYYGDRIPWLTVLDSNMDIVWELNTDTIAEGQYFEQVEVYNGVIYLFGRIDVNEATKLAITKVDMEGEIQDYIVTDLDCNWFADVEIIAGSYYICQENKVVCLQEDGNTGEVFVHNDKKYNIMDMAEYKDNLYISCYEFLGEGDIGAHSECEELYEILDFESDIINGSIYYGKKEMDMIRDNYEARLFVYDIESEECTEISSEKKAIGDIISINKDGELVWNVQKFEKGRFSLMTSSFSVETINSVYEYIFDADNELKSKNKMDTAVYFRR